MKYAPHQQRVIDELTELNARLAKLEDFIMPEFDIAMFADSSGSVGKIVFPEVA